MYKVGDEVLVKAKIARVDEIDNALSYEVTTNHLGLIWVAEDEIAKSEHYARGLSDAWELARNLYCEYSDTERRKILGIAQYETILECMTYAEALAKIEAYEREKEIKPTDIVEHDGKNWVVTEVYKGEYSIWNGKKVIHTTNVKKVGNAESIEPLAELLRQIGE